MFKAGSNNSDTKSQTLAPADVPRKLTARDVGLGIGRKATDEELEDYLNRPGGKVFPSRQRYYR
jgi:hypothetical protein